MQKEVEERLVDAHHWFNGSISCMLCGVTLDVVHRVTNDVLFCVSLYEPILCLYVYYGSFSLLSFYGILLCSDAVVSVYATCIGIRR